MYCIQNASRMSYWTLDPLVSEPTGWGCSALEHPQDRSQPQRECTQWTTARDVHDSRTVWANRPPDARGSRTDWRLHATVHLPTVFLWWGCVPVLSGAHGREWHHAAWYPRFCSRSIPTVTRGHSQRTKQLTLCYSARHMIWRQNTWITSCLWMGGWLDYVSVCCNTPKHKNKSNQNQNPLSD